MVIQERLRGVLKLVRKLVGKKEKFHGYFILSDLFLLSERQDRSILMKSLGNGNNTILLNYREKDHENWLSWIPNEVFQKVIFSNYSYVLFLYLFEWRSFMSPVCRSAEA